MKPVTNETILAELQYELKMKRRVFPTWVRDERMTREKADERIANTEAAVAHFERLVESERNQLALFPEAT